MDMTLKMNLTTPKNTKKDIVASNPPISPFIPSAPFRTISRPKRPTNSAVIASPTSFAVSQKWYIPSSARRPSPPPPILPWRQLRPARTPCSFLCRTAWYPSTRTSLRHSTQIGTTPSPPSIASVPPRNRPFATCRTAYARPKWNWGSCLPRGRHWKGSGEGSRHCGRRGPGGFWCSRRLLRRCGGGRWGGRLCWKSQERMRCWISKGARPRGSLERWWRKGE
mmetsp:Transcript_14267/g.31235  ORF Transcript_14267/g.31235 Transcript_14267/m.31235 type:complete len:223 (-) Transcript_14267:36-704(-)